MLRGHVIALSVIFTSVSFALNRVEMVSKSLLFCLHFSSTTCCDTAQVFSMIPFSKLRLAWNRDS
jgi:hypothetical protein